MFPDPKMETFKELVRQERYTEARQVLLTTSHPKAAQILRKLDEKERAFNKRRSNRNRLRFMLVLLIFVVGAAALFIVPFAQRQHSGAPIRETALAVFVDMCNTNPDNNSLEEREVCVREMGTAVATINPQEIELLLTALPTYLIQMETIEAEVFGVYRTPTP